MPRTGGPKLVATHLDPVRDAALDAIALQQGKTRYQIAKELLVAHIDRCLEDQKYKLKTDSKQGA